MDDFDKKVIATIEESMAEARRYLKRAEARVKELRNPPHIGVWNGTPVSGAMKRASMDLTRALANVRRPQT